MSENYEDLFNLSAENFQDSTAPKTEVERYKPTAKAGKDNVYKSVIRFLPWHKDPKRSIMSKWTAWLEDPVSGDVKYVDCPSSIGKKSLLQDIYWKLKKSESVAEQELAKSFSRRQTFASIIQVIKDDNQPDLVGKILIFPYGVKVHNKIMAQIKPEFGKPHVPFDLFDGRPFLLNIALVAGYNNYDNCAFLDEKLPFTIDGEELEKSQDSLVKIVEHLKEKCPDLSKYDYREWDDDTTNFVMSVVKNTIPKGKVIESIKSANVASFAAATIKTKSVDLDTAKIIEHGIDDSTKTNDIIPTPISTNDDFNIDNIDFENIDDEDLYDKL